MQKETQFLDLGSQGETLSPESLNQSRISLLNFGAGTISFASNKSEQLSVSQKHTLLVKVWGWGGSVGTFQTKIQCRCPPLILELLAMVSLIFS